jgi:hypothetical protein
MPDISGDHSISSALEYETTQSSIKNSYSNFSPAARRDGLLVFPYIRPIFFSVEVFFTPLPIGSRWL